MGKIDGEDRGKQDDVLRKQPARQTVARLERKRLTTARLNPAVTQNQNSPQKS